MKRFNLFQRTKNFSKFYNSKFYNSKNLNAEKEEFRVSKKSGVSAQKALMK